MHESRLRTLTILSAIFLIAGLAIMTTGFLATKGTKLIDPVLNHDRELLAKMTADDLTEEAVNLPQFLEGAAQMHAGLRQMFSSLASMMFLLGALVSGTAIVLFVKVRSIHKDNEHAA